MERRAAARPHPSRVLVAAALAALLPLSSCSDDDGGAATAPTGAANDGSVDGPPEEEGDGGSTGTLELEPSSTTTTTPEDLAVSQLLLEQPPLDGFARADDVLGTGPLDLDAAARAESDVPAERALLETRGFERGASRAWLDPDQDVVYVAVYDFGDAEGASAYLEDGAETLRARGATAFEVPEVEGAVGFTTIEESSEGTFTAHAVAFARGDRWVLALVGSPGSGRSPDDARAVAAAQAARLA